MTIDGARHLRTTDLHVHLLIGDEVLRRGVEALVRAVPSVAEVTVHGGRGGPPGLGAHPGREVLITTPHDARGWSGLRGQVDRARAKTIILLGDVTDVAGAGAVPADGFLIQRQVTASALAAALEQVASGTVPMPAGLARLLLAADGAEGRRGPGAPALTARENETLGLLAQGLSNRQLGRRLGISEHGAKRLVTNVLIKLDAPNRTAAVVTGLRRGLIR